MSPQSCYLQQAATFITTLSDHDPFELLGTKAEINLALTRCQQHPAELHLGNVEPSGESGGGSESHVTELPGTQGGGGEAMSRLCLQVLVGG